MRQFLHKKFGTSSIQHIDKAELKGVLEGEPLMKRAMYRELGGPSCSRYASAGFMISLWFVYIVVSGLFIYYDEVFGVPPVKQHPFKNVGNVFESFVK